MASGTILYDARTGASLGVGSSKAAAATLYDAAGVPLPFVGSVSPSLVTYSYTATGFIGATGANTNFLLHNKGAQFMRLRSIFLAANNVSGATAAQVGMFVQRFQTAGQEVVTGGALVLLMTSIVSASAKASEAPPPLATFYALAGGLGFPTHYNIQTITEFAIPLRQASSGSFYLPFDGDGPDAAFLLAPHEGIRVVGLSTSPPTNAITCTMDWDEQRAASESPEAP